MTPLLVKLKQTISQLEQKLTSINLGELNEPCFDEHLFNTRLPSKDSAFYLQKVNQTYQALTDSITLNDIDKISYFSDLLINQITALTREISTHHLRDKQSDPIGESLFEKHSRHLDYLRRLQEMKYEAELTADSLDYRKIATLDNRIYRCEQAIKQLERQMETGVE